MLTIEKALYIVGPTASGKTSLALDIGKTFSGVLISADSKQVYKGLDIVPGKDIPEDASFHLDSAFSHFSNAYHIGYYLIDQTPLYLLDVVDASYGFTVHDYLTVAPPVIEKTAQERKLPIIVGGSGFYVKALLDGIATANIPMNQSLRNTLSSFSVEELVDLLQKENPEKLASMNESDRKNPRRLARAIEISLWEKEKGKKEKNEKVLETENPLIIGLTAERQVLHERIDKRVQERIELGAVEEAQALFQKIDTLSEQVKMINGYKQLFAYFEGLIGYDEAIEKWKQSEYYNAKKQMTWFGKDKRVQWFDITEPGVDEKIKKKVSEWYEHKNAV